MTTRTDTPPVRAEPPPAYFGHARLEILPLLPTPLGEVLDVGCGAGETLHAVRTRLGCRRTVGLELSPRAAELAARRLDQVVQGDAETDPLPFPPAAFDVILCLDVLEHLRDPWAAVRRLASHLRPGGVLVASIPNARHYRLVAPLVFRGRWNYADEGILDRTHLRFFVRDTAVALLAGAGLDVERVLTTGMPPGSRTRLFNRLSLGLFRPFLEAQYLIRARKPAQAGAGSPP